MDTQNNQRENDFPMTQTNKSATTLLEKWRHVDLSRRGVQSCHRANNERSGFYTIPSELQTAIFARPPARALCRQPRGMYPEGAGG